MPSRLALAAVLLATAGSPPAVAAEGGEACTKVVEALHALGEAARYHWTMSATTPTRRRPMRREQVVIDDIVYLTPDNGRWMKQRIDRADRAARMATEIAQKPVADCRAEGTETRDNIVMSMYAYRQGEAAKRIWVGAADSLPYYFTSDEPPVSVTMRVDYTEVPAPLP